MATLAQLETQIKKLQRRADVLRERKSAEVIASIRSMMKEHGLTTADIAKEVQAKKRGRPVGSKNASAVAKKTGAKSKLPPKYRDPASGATWSGHARPPAWIKDAADRNVFLIDGATNGSKPAKKAARGRPASAMKRVGRPAAKKGARKGSQSATA